MKRVFMSLGVIALLMSSCGEAAKDEANEKSSEKADEQKEEVRVEEESEYTVEGYEYYGIKEMTPDNAVSVVDMKASVAENGSFDGKINAKLTGVCKKAGCWVTIADGDNDIRVMFGEHDFFVPVDTDETLDVVLEGSALVDTVSVDMQKHFLDDAMEAGEVVTPEQYDAITEDLIEVSFIASGILLKK